VASVIINLKATMQELRKLDNESLGTLLCKKYRKTSTGKLDTILEFKLEDGCILLRGNTHCTVERIKQISVSLRYCHGVLSLAAFTT
jgi:hypothetical protein